MRTRRSPRNQESMLRIVSGIKDKQALIMNNAKQRERIAELEAELAAEKERHANNHAAWTAANEELRDAHQRALNERDAALDNLRAADKELRAKDDLWYQKITQAYEFMQQRDAARAWAAAWRTSAHVWRREMMVPRTLTFRANLGMASAERRARRAAEAMERR